MFATGALDPNWWKHEALIHRWYKDEDAYADYRTGVLTQFGAANSGNFCTACGHKRE